MPANDNILKSTPDLTKVYELKPTGFLETMELPDIQEQVDELLTKKSETKVIKVKSKVTQPVPASITDKPAPPKPVKMRIYLDHKGNSINNSELKQLLEKGYDQHLDLTDPEVLGNYLQDNASDELLSQLVVITAGNIGQKNHNAPEQFEATPGLTGKLQGLKRKLFH